MKILLQILVSFMLFGCVSNNNSIVRPSKCVLIDKQIVAAKVDEINNENFVARKYALNELRKRHEKLSSSAKSTDSLTDLQREEIANQLGALYIDLEKKEENLKLDIENSKTAPEDWLSINLLPNLFATPELNKIDAFYDKQGNLLAEKNGNNILSCAEYKPDYTETIINFINGRKH